MPFTGTRTTSSSWPRSTTGCARVRFYIHALKLALDHGLPIRALPRLMNGFSVLCSSSASGRAFILFPWRLTGRHIAAAATVIYALDAVLLAGQRVAWHADAAGAHVLGFCNARGFARATDEPGWQSRHFAGFMALALACACVAFALKADMALSGGALLAILILDWRSSACTPAARLRGRRAGRGRRIYFRCSMPSVARGPSTGCRGSE